MPGSSRKRGARKHQRDVLQKRRFTASGVTHDHQLRVSKQCGLDVDRTGFMEFGLIGAVLVEHDSQTYIDIA